LVDKRYLKVRKVVSFSSDSKDEAIKRFGDRGFSLQKRLLYPSIAQVFDFKVNEAKNRITITRDFLGGGTLEALIEEEYQNDEVPGFDFTQKLIMAFVMSKTVSFMHLQQILYRDLSVGQWGIDERFLPVLLDFGYAKSVEYIDILTDITGALYRSPPEMITKLPFDAYKASELPSETLCKVDVYSFGMTLYELFTGLQPFPNRHDLDIVEQIIGGLRPSFDGLCPPVSALQDICERCWSANPADRPTMEEVTRMIMGLVDDGPSEEFVDRERFMEIVDEWDAKLARAQREELSDEFLHGAVEKLEMCAERGWSSAIRHLDLVKKLLER
jgi:serine/threonine protein kinase